MDFIMLGKRIRDERLLLRLTLEKLAEKINKSSNFIGQIERGERKLSLETLVDISNALGTTIDYLLKDNIKVTNDNVMNEINRLLVSINDKGRNFFLDTIKQYIYYHTTQGNISDELVVCPKKKSQNEHFSEKEKQKLKE